MNELSAFKNQKSTLRQEALALRGQLPMSEISQDVCAVLAGWPPFEAARQVLAYYPFRAEVDLWGLVLAHPKKHWYLPTISAEHSMEFYRYNPEQPLQIGKYGIAEPVPDGLPFTTGNQTTLILTPGVLFDRQGYRLGYGKGYYDRFLSRPGMASCHRVGITPTALLHEQLPHDAWDMPMQAIVTEAGIIMPNTR